MPPWQLALSTIPVAGPAFAPSLGMSVTFGYCLMWNCPWGGPPAVSCPQLDCFRVSNSKVCICRLCWLFMQQFWQCSKRKRCKRCADYNWKNLLLSGDGTIFRGFLPSQPWLASQPTSAWLHSPLLYIDKYIEIGTISLSETFTRMVLHAFTVSYEILKSHYLQWNPPSSLSCHLFSWSKWNLGLGGLQKWPWPVLSPRLVSAAS